MNQTTITVIINNNRYSLSTSNVEAIRMIPDADLQQLIGLLEVVKQQQGVAKSAVTPATKVKMSTTYNAGAPINPHAMRSERLSSGDVDTLVAQLMMEERSKQKPALTQQTIYKWVGGIAVVIILLVLVM